jgi:hypothetical protein
VTAQTTAPAAAFVPAWFCPNADLTLMWGQLHGVVYGWQLRYRGRLIGTLVGFPVGAPPNGEREALAWADTVAGLQQWIARPARSGANHTHANSGITCPPPIYVPDETEENPS